MNWRRPGRSVVRRQLGSRNLWAEDTADFSSIDAFGLVVVPNNVCFIRVNGPFGPKGKLT